MNSESCEPRCSAAGLVIFQNLFRETPDNLNVDYQVLTIPLNRHGFSQSDRQNQNACQNSNHYARLDGYADCGVLFFASDGCISQYLAHVSPLNDVDSRKLRQKIPADCLIGVLPEPAAFFSLSTRESAFAGP